MFDGWFGLITNAGTPKPVIDKLNAAVVKILRDPAVAQQLQNQGADPMPMTPEEYDKYIRSEVVKLGKVVRESGAKAE